MSDGGVMLYKVLVNCIPSLMPCATSLTAAGKKLLCAQMPVVSEVIVPPTGTELGLGWCLSLRMLCAFLLLR